MGYERISVSITPQMKAYLEKYDLSASELLQQSIMQIMKMTDQTKKENEDLRKKVIKYSKALEILGSNGNDTSSAMIQAVKELGEQEHVAVQTQYY